MRMAEGWGGGAPIYMKDPGARRNPASRLQPLRHRDQPLHLMEPQRQMGLEAGVVVAQQVRPHLPVPLLPRPSLGGLHQPGPDARTPEIGIHIPPLDERHRARLAPLGVHPLPDLDEAAQPTIVAGGTETRLPLPP